MGDHELSIEGWTDSASVRRYRELADRCYGQNPEQACEYIRRADAIEYWLATRSSSEPPAMISHAAKPEAPPADKTKPAEKQKGDEASLFG